MDGKIVSNNYPFGNNRHENDHSPENSDDSPDHFTADTKFSASTSSPKRRRAIQKRVVSVPIKDGEGSRFKGESSPPSDSWAWRKYGQKPIKGSPYPRGYYRCSSSKGCPARKQVERSRLDPTMLVITYSCEHNHSAPTTNRNSHHNSSISPVIPVAAVVAPPPPAAVAVTAASTASNNSESEISNVFVSELDTGLVESEGFRWFSDLEATSSAGMLESPMILSAADGDMDMAAMMYSMRGGEDDSLFADLGELPECSVVFRRGTIEKEEERRRISVAPWCGTSG
ncbi:probable WRKY transcription factor 65 isoform X2 [Impatiens glandulifera]|uniref:probable WRKY transcription factor 65 isoform X2 n=1 Tax=Impatiens glandulifera TaxID=253017 RepID=UPI001FB18DC8|nr:probable WRKY transcription factor 65 isoform X2 [Impatiens glandulifera]